MVELQTGGSGPGHAMENADLLHGQRIRPVHRQASSMASSNESGRRMEKNTGSMRRRSSVLSTSIGEERRSGGGGPDGPYVAEVPKSVAGEAAHSGQGVTRPRPFIEQFALSSHTPLAIPASLPATMIAALTADGLVSFSSAIQRAAGARDFAFNCSWFP